MEDSIEEAVPLRVVNSSEAIAYVPADTRSGDAFLFRTGFEGLRLRLRFHVVEASVSCLNVFHEDLTRRVTVADPAERGETVRVILSGVTGELPLLREPEAAEILSLQNDQSLQLQMLDLRILRPFTANSALFASDVRAIGCPAPPVR